MTPRLPIDLVMPQVLAALKTRTALVLRAPTGAGKTTRVPPALLDAGLAGAGRVVMLEPRRLAARAAARRMAQERGQRVGDEIGYHVRFDRQAGPRTRVLVVTPGILLRMLHDDPFLESIGLVVFDEFHERGLETDLALGMARLLQQTVRPDLRLLVMSATLNTDAISRYLGDSPVVTSEGRLHPVEIRYEARPTQQPLGRAVAEAVARLLAATDGDVLAFLPGMQEIRQAQRELAALAGDLLILPLHGDLPPEEQDRALLPQSKRKVVLATNVAETSVTVEGVAAVVDSGMARMLQFDPHVGMDRLELGPIARDSADQRAGRAGRLRPGVCVRLWSEASHRQRDAQTEPEIRRVDLAGAVLHLMALGETDLEKFPWLEPPRPEAVAQSLLLLQRLGAVHDGQLTEQGRVLARLPAPPRLGRLMLEGDRFGQPPRAALAAAILSERDPFVRSFDGPAPRPKKWATASDVLDRVEALEQFEQHNRVETALGTLHAGAARTLLRTRDQLLRTLRQDAPASDNPLSLDRDEAVLRAILAAFPDRVARRRDLDRTRGVMVGGKGVRLAPGCRVEEAELFVCVDVDAQLSEAFVRQASSLQRDWLPAELVVSRVEVDFDREQERVVARRRVRYLDLLLDEDTAAFPDDEAPARVLAEAALRDLPRVLPEPGSAAYGYMQRVRWLSETLPELKLPGFEEGDLREVLPWLCRGRRSFADLRRADWLSHLQGMLTRQQTQVLEREAPEKIEVPTGSMIGLQYEPGRAPVLAVRIQEMFGQRETPRLAGGRVRVLLHLLAPNYRPQQVTEDLASFWANTYPLVRKELRARYPRHAWPDDPTTAAPVRGPKKRPPV